METQPSLRAFGDSKTTRKAIYDNTMSAITGLEPLSDGNVTLRLKDVDWADPDRFTRKQRKMAVLGGETLARRIRGTWELSDAKTGQVLDSRKQIIAKVPYLSSMGTFTHNGTEYTVNHQQRLLPGIYARVQDNGNIESHVNVLPGEGRGHRYYLDPATGLFKIRVAQAEMPIVPLLRAMGVTEEQLREAWGDDLATANLQKADARVIPKLADRILNPKQRAVPESELPRVVAETFAGMKLDPTVTAKTLGKPYDKLGAETILAATKKLLAVSRGEQQPDDRDHPAFQKVFGPEDLFAERIKRDHSGVRRGIFRQVASAKNLEKMPSGALTSQLEQLLVGSGLASTLEEINLLEVLDKQTRVTRMGEGGIPCYSADTEVFTSTGWKMWPDVLESDLLACRIADELQFHRPSAVHRYEYSGPMFNFDSRSLDYLVTPDHRLWVSATTSGDTLWQDWGFRTAEEVHDLLFKVKTSAPAGFSDGIVPVIVIPPAPTHKQNAGAAVTEPVVVSNVEAWFVFMAAYLADGSFTYASERKEYRVEIGKKVDLNRAEYEEIAAALSQLPFTWRYEQGRRFVISGKHLAYYLSQFGKSKDKFIPDYVKNATTALRRRFLFSLTRFDNSEDSSHSRLYASASRRLRDDVADMAIRLGLSVRYSETRRDRQFKLRIIYRDTACPPCNNKKRKAVRKVLPYTGMVYCASVPGELLFVRRNGKCHWSGNSVDSVTDEARSVQPANLGFIDPVRTPESLRAGVDVHFSSGARKGNDGKIYTKVRDYKTGEQVWRSPQDLADKTITTADAFKRGLPLVPAMKGGDVDYVEPSAVDYVFDDFESASFSALANLIPFKAASKPHRMAMGARYLTQALPLVDAEAPLVRNAVPGAKDGWSYEDEYASHAGAVRASQGGRVLKFDGDTATVRYDDGSTEDIDLYRTMPMNRKTAVSQDLLVQPGQRFEKGQPLVKSNYTDTNGAIALGKNLRTAYMAYKGLNFEDAMVISESAAKKLTSEHAYQNHLEVDDSHKLGKDNYTSLFPGRYEKKILDTMDKNGIIKVGETVTYGQPLILAAKGRADSANKVFKKKQPAFSDATVTWDHHDPGIVTDVVEAKTGPVVLVTSKSSMNVGDKLSGRYGDKGVVSAIVPDDQMPTGEDGKPFEILLSPDGLISRCYDDQTEFCTDSGWKFGRDVLPGDSLAAFDPLSRNIVMSPQLERMYEKDYSGDMLAFKSKVMDFCVTPNHKMWAAPEARPTWRELVAENITRGRWFVPIAGNPAPGVDSDFDLPNYIRTSIKDVYWRDEKVTFSAGDWAEFLGWYAAEGSCDYIPGPRPVYKTHIAQFATVHPDNCRQIAALLTRLGLSWHYTPANGQFHIPGKRLAAYMKLFGKSHERFIPQWLFSQSFETRKRFLDAYWAGDGNISHGRNTRIIRTGTTSRRLADDLQRLLVLQGESAAVYPKHERPESRPAWTVARHINNTRLLKGRDWRRVSYAGKVYCPTVMTGYVVTRRNGRILIAGNTNASQSIEAALGKLAEKLGRPIAVPDFSDIEDVTAWTQELLQKHGLKSTESVTLPDNGTKINDIGTGSRFYMKLHHMAEDKAQGRGGGGYSSDDTPSKGGPSGCFTGDTLVTTTEGPVRLDEIVRRRRRPFLVTRDPELRWRQTVKRLIDHFEYEVYPEELLSITLENGVVITTTLGHEFVLADKSRVLASNLKVGDDLMEERP